MPKLLSRLVPRVLALVLFTAAAQAQTASLVRDIKSQGEGEGRAPEKLYSMPGKLFFFGGGIDGWGVWASDGTSAGTSFLVDLCPQNDCYPGGYGFVGHVGGTVLWVSLGPDDLAPRLWRSDGTRAGTWPVAGPGTAIRNILINLDRPEERTHVLFQGAFYFQGCNETSCATYRLAGSAAEAVETGDLGRSPTVVGDRLFFLDLEGSFLRLRVTADPSNGSTPLALFSRPDRLTAAGNELFFVADEGAQGEELWVSDGTAAGTRAVTSFVPDEPLVGEPLHPAGNKVYFIADDVVHGREIWVSDGTPQGTRRVTDFGYDSPVSGDFDAMAEIGGRLVFFAYDGIHPPWLWTTGGTPESTAPLPSCPTCELLDSPVLVRAGGRILFRARDAAHGSELWGTDGTSAGTGLVADICPGSCDSMYYDTQLLPWPGGALLMAADDATHGQEIWLSDGTPAGTRRATELPASAGLDYLSFTPPASFAGKIWFAAGRSYEDAGLWVTDGTPESTRLAARLGRSAPSSEPGHLTAAGGRLWFTADDGTAHGLWSTLGSPDGTVLVTTANPNPDAPDRIDGVSEAGGLAYFWEEHFVTRRLRRTDGTAAGTFTLLEDEDLRSLGAAFQGRLYFTTFTQLWRSDGTVAGTVPIFTSSAGLYPAPAVAGGALYFVAGDELWRSNGTAGGTQKLASVPGITYGELRFVSSGALVFFSAGEQLWKTDGTPGGTQMVAQPGGVTDLTAFQGAVYFFAYRPNGKALWRSDGTAAGTAAVGGSLEFRHEPYGLTVFADKLFFAAGDAEHGFELWTSDGTEAGTVILRDLFPGPRSSVPRELTVAGGRLFFAAGDGPHGTELWMSDGTAAGTRLVQDLNPWADSSLPEQLTAAGDRLYFTADDGLSGRELWTLHVPGSGCQPAADRLCLNNGRFQVEAAWKDFQGNRGTGQAVALTADTGYFWFFSPANVEAVLKVLDGRGLNDHFWVFYGALSSVEYNLTVTDTQTGLTRRYYNPPGQLASVGDTNGFGPLGAFSKTAATGPCQPTAERLCLDNQRFAVEVAWKDFQGNQGTGKAVNLTADTGYFWFFDAANVELVLKVLDGTGLNGKHWVFYGALSSVEYTITVTDTQTGVQRTYRNPSGGLASAADTEAF